MNLQALLDSLQNLADQAGPEKSVLIQKYVAASRAQTLSLACMPLAQADPSVNYHGRFGGVPLMPQDFAWPNRPKRCADGLYRPVRSWPRLPATDVNCPRNGLLSIFRTPQILTMPAKDRRAFHIFYLPHFQYTQLIASQPPPLASQPSTNKNQVLPEWSVLAEHSWSVSEVFNDLKSTIGLSETTIDQLTKWAIEFNKVSCGSSRLFGSRFVRPRLRQKEVCAFAASGISHSAAKAGASHYSHLMDEVPN